MGTILISYINIIFCLPIGRNYLLKIFFCTGYGQGSFHNQLRGPEPHALLAQGGGHGLGGSDQEGNQVNVLEWSSLKFCNGPELIF